MKIHEIDPSEFKKMMECYAFVMISFQEVVYEFMCAKKIWIEGGKEEHWKKMEGITFKHRFSDMSAKLQKVYDETIPEEIRYLFPVSLKYPFD